MNPNEKKSISAVLAMMLAAIGLALLCILPQISSTAVLIGSVVAAVLCFLVLGFTVRRFYLSDARKKTILVCLLTVVAVIAVTEAARSWGYRKSITRFLRDRRAVVETIRGIDQPYNGLVSSFPKPVHANPDFPGEDFVRRYLESSTSWRGNGHYQAIYRPDPAADRSARLAVDASEVFDFYFARLEASGFTSGVHGSTCSANVDSLQFASRTWSNQDRSIHVTGEVVTDKRSGETIVTVYVTEDLSHRKQG